MIEKITQKLTAKCREWYEIWDANHDDEYADGKNEGFIEALDIVQEVAKEHGNEWISCSERLPQESEPVDRLCQIVNVTLKNGMVTVGWCNRLLEKWYVLDWHCDYPVSRKYEDVIAWMPLPTGYEPKDAPYQKGE